MEILNTVSRHDREFAATLLKSTADDRSPVSQAAPRCVGCGVQSGAVTQTLRLAIDTVQADPQQAVKLAKEGLSGGLNSLIYSVLVALRRKDPTLADELFSYTVAMARQRTLYLSDGAYFLAAYVFPDFGAGAIQVSPRPAPTEVKPQVIEQYLTFFADAAEKEATTLQARGRDADDSQFGRRVSLDYFLGEHMLPYFERHMPDRVAAVRASIDQIIAVIPASEAKPYLDDINRARTGAYFSEKAETEKDLERQQNYYMEAAFQANARREHDDALAILPKITDETVRSFVESIVRYEMAMTALNKGDIDSAYNLAADVSNLSRRASLLGHVAVKRLFQGDAQSAAQALTQAEHAVQRAETGFEKATEMVNLVNAATWVDVARGFEDLSLAVDALNAAEVPRQWALNKPVISKSTGKMFTSVYTGLGLLMFENGLMRLARADFNRTLQLVEAIQSREALALAELALCKIALGQPYPASSQNEIQHIRVNTPGRKND